MSISRFAHKLKGGPLFLVNTRCIFLEVQMSAKLISWLFTELFTANYFFLFSFVENQITNIVRHNFSM